MFNRMAACAALVASAGWFVSGCASSAGYKRADKTGEGIAEYRTEVVNVRKAMNFTLASLDQIEATADTNPRPAFEKFAKNVRTLESAAAKAIKRSAEMKAKGDAFFRQWEEQLAQVKNAEIRQLAEQRKEKLRAAFDGIKQVAEPLQAKFDPWLGDLKDLQTYVSNDLTIAGVDAARGQFAKAKADGTEVEKAMDTLIAELNSIAAAVTPAKVEKRK